jgi:ABC-type glycerol-3-phosphate transport system substrate-binding protein
MRKSMKLAAASALAAVALVGGTASAAMAAGVDHDDDHGWNFCGNGDGNALVSAKDNGEVYTDDVEVVGVNKQTICQVGEDNEATNINRGDVAGDDLSDITDISILDDFPPGPPLV